MPPAIIKDKHIVDMQNIYKDAVNLASFILRLEMTTDIPSKPPG